VPYEYLFPNPQHCATARELASSGLAGFQASVEADAELSALSARLDAVLGAQPQPWDFVAVRDVLTAQEADGRPPPAVGRNHGPAGRRDRWQDKKREAAASLFLHTLQSISIRPADRYD